VETPSSWREERRTSTDCSTSGTACATASETDLYPGIRFCFPWHNRCRSRSTVRAGFKFYRKSEIIRYSSASDCFPVDRIFQSFGCFTVFQLKNFIRGVATPCAITVRPDKAREALYISIYTEVLLLQAEFAVE
jgi:hypothetical protein